MKKTLFLLTTIISLPVLGIAQTFSVEVTITNQPKNNIVFGSVKGDDFTPIDSSYLYPESNKVKFQFPANAQPGLYRVVLGQTAYAKVMDEPPQQITFIFNNENLVFKTDYKEPDEKLEIVQSAENRIWFDFLAKDKIIRQEIKALQKDLDYNWSVDNKDEAVKIANDFNTLQMERDLLVMQTAKESPNLLVSAFVKNQRRPILDGYLTPAERVESFKKEYFNTLDFTDERLIQSSVYTDNVFEYLVSYNNPELSQEQREKEYRKAIDIIVQNTNKNEQVYRFILDYMIHGFTVLKQNNTVSYIRMKYKSPR